jgi:hypothetical protein
MRFDAKYLADPHGFFRELRESGPVRQVEMPNGTTAWVVTRYTDVYQACADARLSINNEHARGWRGLELPPQLNATLMNVDPPAHSRLRRLVAKAFTPRQVDQMRGRIQEVTDELLDAVAPHGQADLNAALAAPLPLTVIGEMLGIPPRDHGDFQQWLSTLLAAEAGLAAPEEARAAVGSMVAFLTALVAGKRDALADDILSHMISVRESGDQLSDHELTSLTFLIFSAGYETTVSLIGNAVIALLGQPDQWAALRDEPELIPGAVEEILRFDGPALVAVRRFATEDLEIGQARIPAGDTVMLALASANRDPAQFSGSDMLDVRRKDNTHVAFGHGIHFCLGAPLARLEGEIALATLLRRFPDLALAVPVGELEWRPSLRTRGVAALPVTFTPHPGRQM